MSMLTKWNPLKPSRWEPFRELEEMENRMTKFFNEFPTPLEFGKVERITPGEWTPSVDVVEDEKEYVIKAELPEVKKEDVKVNVENGTLTISGERKLEKEEKGKKYHRLERAYGSFLRSFSVAEGTKPDRIVAEFKDGVLKVHLPKDEKTKAKAMDVKVE